MRITLMEYAARLGKNPVLMRQKALRGGFKTAIKLGRDWFIDEDEVFLDLRRKEARKDMIENSGGRL